MNLEALSFRQLFPWGLGASSSMTDSISDVADNCRELIVNMLTMFTTAQGDRGIPTCTLNDDEPEAAEDVFSVGAGLRFSRGIQWHAPPEMF